MEYKTIKFNSNEKIDKINEILKIIQFNHDIYETNSKKLYELSRSDLETLGFVEFKKDNYKIEAKKDLDRFKKIDALSSDGIAIKFLTGRAVTNNEYLTAIISAGLIKEIDKLIICVFDNYKNAKDFRKVVQFVDLISSSKINFNIGSVTIIGLKHQN